MTQTFNLDCMTAMREFPDKFFQLAIVDPPYGNNMQGGRSAKNGWNQSIDWDKCNNGWNLIVPGIDYFTELQRVSKNQIVWGGNYFANILPNSQCWVVWDKGQREFSLADGELAWTSFDQALRIKTIHRSVANQEDKYHPTQKPVSLYKWLLQNYAKPGDKILDTHGGSMSSVIACLEMGFDCWCYEKDPDYFLSAKKRIEQYIAQQKLFDTHQK